MSKETAKDQKRRKDGTFAPKDSGGDDSAGERVESVSVGTAEEKNAFEESMDRPGLSISEGKSRIEELVEAAANPETEPPEDVDPEALEDARRTLEESGSIEAAQEAIEENLTATEATEAEAAEEASEPIPLHALAEELGFDPAQVTTSIKVDGEEQEVTLEDLRDGHMRQKAFTKKTQELAEQRNQVEQLQEQYAQGLEMLAVGLGQSLNPEQQQALAAEYNRVVGEIEARTHEARAGTVAKEQDALKEAIGVEDDAEWDSVRQDLRTYATEELGYTDEHLAQVTDHRPLLLAYKAMQFDRMQVEGQEIASRRRKPRRTVKPGATTKGTKQPKESTEAAAARKRLKRTGSVQDGAKALEGLLGEDA